MRSSKESQPEVLTSPRWLKITTAHYMRSCKGVASMVEAGLLRPQREAASTVLRRCIPMWPHAPIGSHLKPCPLRGLALCL
jgi:hypothetical protein